MSSITDASDRAQPSTSGGPSDANERDDPASGERKLRATSAWDALNHAMLGSLPRALGRSQRSRERLRRMR